MLDVICSLLAIIVFSLLYVIIAILVWVKLGSPIIFKQPRPGLIGSDGKEKIFYMYKFRTMTDGRDEQGNLLPDEVRLTSFGKKLRATSLDGKVIIGTTTESLENKWFREVSPIPFFMGRDLFSTRSDLFDIDGGMKFLAWLCLQNAPAVHASYRAHPR